VDFASSLRPAAEGRGLGVGNKAGGVNAATFLVNSVVEEEEDMA